MPGEVVAEGKWEFTWNTGEVEKGTKFEVNRTYNLGGYDVLIKSIELTPLSCTVSADLEDTLKIEEDERNTFTYEGDDPGLAPDQRLSLTAVEYQDGTKIDFAHIGGGGTSVDEEKQSYLNYQSLNTVIDVDQVQAIYIMQGDVKIPLR